MNLLIGPDEVVRVKILTAGDEISLEEKINGYLEEHSDQVPAEIGVRQVEYHARTGSIDFGLIAVLIMRVKRSALAAAREREKRASSDFGPQSS